MALDTTDSTNTCTRIIESILEGHAQQQCVVRAANRVRALQIDGGGFLGYVMFAALKVLESRSPNGRLCYAFDVIYGTSTGAIIGAALAAGASVAEVEALYAQHGDHIFTQVNPWWMPWRKLTRPFYDSNRVLDPLSALLKRYGVTYMADLKTRFVAVTVDTCKRENVFQKSWKPEYSFLEVTECVARSFAALFYFGQRIDKKRLTCFGDGATGALNCALIFSYFEAQAIAIANERTPATSNGVDTDAKLPPVHDVDLYSFGCGTVPIPQSYARVSRFSNIQQLWYTFMAGGQLLARMQSAQDQVRGLQWLIQKQAVATDYKGTDVHLFRFDAALSEKINHIDKPCYIKEYAAAGEALAQQHDTLLRFW